MPRASAMRRCRRATRSSSPTKTGTWAGGAGDAMNVALRTLPPARFAFEPLLRARGLSLTPLSVDTLQANITKTCNQACRHCHVDASPARTESMSRAGIEKLVEILARHPQVKKL